MSSALAGVAMPKRPTPIARPKTRRPDRLIPIMFPLLTCMRVFSRGASDAHLPRRDVPPDQLSPSFRKTHKKRVRDSEDVAKRNADSNSDWAKPPWPSDVH